MTPAAANIGFDTVQEHPSELETTQSVRPEYGERNEELPEQLQNALKEIARQFAQQEMYVRRREVLRDRMNRFYERGYQHIYVNRSSGTFMQMAPGSIGTNTAGASVQAPNYIDDYNIFQPFLRILLSILTQNRPGIEFRPFNPASNADIEAAETAEGYKELFDRSNDVKEIQRQIVRMMALGGRVILWTRTEANAMKFGLTPEREPKQMETATVYGTLESRVPILAKSQADCLYCFLYDDPDIKQAKKEYPAFASKIKAGMKGITETAYERNARLGVLQGTQSQAQVGEAFSHLATRAHCWIRPAGFESDALNDPFEDDPNLTVKEKLLELFPQGAHCVFVGDVYVGSWDESMDDALAFGFGYEGDGMFRMALMDPMVVPQDRFNDSMNAAAEVFDMGWPSTWVNADETEYDAISNQRADPYAIRIKKARNGLPMDQEFFREPNPELPASFMSFTELLWGALPQFQLATPPAAFGAQMEDQKTATGYAQARNQALGQQGLVWQQQTHLLARMYYQAALCATTNPQHSLEIVVSSEDGSARSVQLERLTKGNFGAYPDEEAGFPESISQKRTTFNGILAMAGQSPILGQQIMESPDNWKLFASIMGFPDLVIPEAEARDKAVFELQRLLEQSPIMPTPDEVMTAQIQLGQQHAALVSMGSALPDEPVPAVDPVKLAKPSIMPSSLDFHAWEFAKFKEWLSSSARRRAEAEYEPQFDEDSALTAALGTPHPGIQNVILYAMELEKAIAASMPPPEQLAPGGGSPPAPKGKPSQPKTPTMPMPAQPPITPQM